MQGRASSRVQCVDLQQRHLAGPGVLDAVVMQVLHDSDTGRVLAHGGEVKGCGTPTAVHS